MFVRPVPGKARHRVWNHAIEDEVPAMPLAMLSMPFAGRRPQVTDSIQPRAATVLVTDGGGTAREWLVGDHETCLGREQSALCEPRNYPACALSRWG